MLTMTALYTGLSALLLVVLSLLVVRERGRARVSLGDGGDAQLQKAIRAQGNFVEYTPLALLVIALVEMQAAPPLAVHALGAALVGGRVLHAAGLTGVGGLKWGRAAGTALTLLVLLFGGAGLIVQAIL